MEPAGGGWVVARLENAGGRHGNPAVRTLSFLLVFCRVDPVFSFSASTWTPDFPNRARGGASGRTRIGATARRRARGKDFEISGSRDGMHTGTLRGLSSLGVRL